MNVSSELSLHPAERALVGDTYGFMLNVPSFHFMQFS